MRFTEAEREFEFAIKLDPKLFEALYHYGRARVAQGEFAEAAKLFERACALRPEDFQAPTFLGRCYTAMGMKEEGNAMAHKALRLIDERLSLNPDDARACQLGATVAAGLGLHEMATDYARRALTINPDDPLLLYNISCMYSRYSAIPTRHSTASKKRWTRDTVRRTGSSMTPTSTPCVRCRGSSASWKACSSFSECGPG